jgi:hypothetical protein
MGILLGFGANTVMLTVLRAAALVPLRFCQNGWTEIRPQARGLEKTAVSRCRHTSGFPHRLWGTPCHAA